MQNNLWKEKLREYVRFDVLLIDAKNGWLTVEDAEKAIESIVQNARAETLREVEEMVTTMVVPRMEEVWETIEKITKKLQAMKGEGV